MTSWNNKKKQISKYYSDLYNKYGACPRASDYGVNQSQLIKFDILASVMPLHNKSVLDVGCGFATFAEYLSDRFEGVNYTGIDLAHECIENAKLRNPSLKLSVYDILSDDMNEHYDLVTANGIFYLLGDDAKELMFKLINRMFSLSRDAVAFNSLSSWCADKQTGEFYADPVEVVNYCRGLTPWVTLRHDYHSRDFTVYLYKDQRQ